MDQGLKPLNFKDCKMDGDMTVRKKRRSPRELLEEPTETELEIIREQAQALWRSGMKVEECLWELRELDREIEACKSRGALEEANRLINRFNELCDRARLYLHYLVVHREAVGFRRHPDLKRIYPIPRKKDLLEDAVRKDHHP